MSIHKYRDRVLDDVNNAAVRLTGQNVSHVAIEGWKRKAKEAEEIRRAIFNANVKLREALEKANSQGQGFLIEISSLIQGQKTIRAEVDAWKKTATEAAAVPILSPEVLESYLRGAGADMERILAELKKAQQGASNGGREEAIQLRKAFKTLSYNLIGDYLVSIRVGAANEAVGKSILKILNDIPITDSINLADEVKDPVSKVCCVACGNDFYGQAFSSKEDAGPYCSKDCLDLGATIDRELQEDPDVLPGCVECNKRQYGRCGYSTSKGMAERCDLYGKSTDGTNKSRDTKQDLPGEMVSSGPLQGVRDAERSKTDELSFLQNLSESIQTFIEIKIKQSYDVFLACPQCKEPNGFNAKILREAHVDSLVPCKECGAESHPRSWTNFGKLLP